ncbi:hypothetical protein [Streptomyces sp. NPDC088915]|uniref:hypothetical protein n=1 Tax=Streptomyces sp. NPDC088915 TaxID=3365912 RepID=UPI003800C0C4
MINLGRNASALVGAALLLTAGIMPSEAATVGVAKAPGCYTAPTNVSFWSYEGTSSTDHSYWPNRGAYTRVSGACNDINVKLDEGRWVKVCGRTWCGSWTWAPVGRWTVVHYNTTYNAEYYLQFKGIDSLTGKIAD